LTRDDTDDATETLPDEADRDDVLCGARGSTVEESAREFVECACRKLAGDAFAELLSMGDDFNMVCTAW
jgi:hypothetical protein